MNLKKILPKTICLMSVIGMIYCIVMSLECNNLHFPLWLLPVTYCAFVLFQSDDDFSTPGIIVLKSVLFFRYIVTPCAIYFTDDVSVYAKNYDYMVAAIFLMLFELIVVMFLISWTEKYSLEEKGKSKQISRRKFKHVLCDTKLLVLFLIIAVLICILFKNPIKGILSMLGGTTIQAADFEKGSSGIVNIIWDNLLVWLYVYFCMQFKRKKLNVHFAIVLSMFFLFLILFGQRSISRWHTIISFVAILFTLLKLYPKKKKELFLWIMTPVVIAIFILTIYKNTSYKNSDSTILDSAKQIFNSSTMDSYFAGPVGVNNAIGLKEEVPELGIKTIVNDTLNSVPKIQGMIDKKKTSVSAYNVYIGRAWDGINGDMIIPLVGQSSIYFGYLLAPLLSALIVLLIRWCDVQFSRCMSGMMYLYAFVGAWAGVAIILNYAIFMSWIYLRVIPLVVLTKGVEIFNHSVKKIKKVRNEKVAKISEIKNV